jgi:lipoprotein-anchoring transpeptidase ErfK/SrfK
VISKATVIAAVAASIVFMGAVAAVVFSPADDSSSLGVARADGAEPSQPDATGRDEDKPRAEAQPPAAQAPAPGTATEDQATFQLNPPPGAYPVLAVRRGAKVEIYSEPGGGKIVDVAGKRTAFGSPTVFGVIREQEGWAGVSTPAVPNGQVGWVRIDPAVVKPAATRSAIVVNVTERVAELREDGEAVLTFPVSVGAPGSDTPLGRYAVTDTFRGGLIPDYGCCALAISATQPRLPSGWLGGNRIAIHATDGPLGQAISHGCVRADDEAVSELVSRVPLGAPVFVRS